MRYFAGSRSRTALVTLSGNDYISLAGSSVMSSHMPARCAAILATVAGAFLPIALPAAVAAQAASEAQVVVEPPLAVVEQARALFAEATALARQGDWAGARERFRRSAELRPHAVTTYDIAYCERALGHATQARALFRAALAARDTQGQLELSTDMLEVARGYVAELEREVGRVDVSLSTHDALLSVDGAPLELSDEQDAGRAVLLGGTRAPSVAEPVPAAFVLLIDPGRHVLAISRNGGRPREVVVDAVLGARAHVELALAPLEPSRVTLQAPTPMHSPFARSQRSDAPARISPVAYVAFGVGAVALASGAVTGTLAAVDEGELRDACKGKVCAGPDGDALDRARTLADVSTASFVAAGIGLAIGGALWLLTDQR